MFNGPLNVINIKEILYKTFPQMNAGILWSILGFFFMIFFIMTGVLLYHWRKYGDHAVGVYTAQVIYFIGAGICFFISIVSIISFLV